VTPVTSFGLMTNAYISAAAGFVSLGSNDNIIQAPNGGMTARRHISTYDIVAVGMGSGFPTGAAGQGKLYFDSAAGKWKAIEGGGTAVNLIGGGTPGGADTHVQYNSSGSFAGSLNLTWSNSLNILTIGGTAQASTGFNSLGTADNSIQCASGGVSSRRLIASLDIVHTGVVTSGAPAGTTGQGKLYYDATTARWMVLQGAAAAVPMIGGGSGTPGGSTTQVQFNNSGAFGGSASFTWNDTTKQLVAIGISNTATISSGTGYIQSDGGFLVTFTNTAFNSIQSSGGLVVKGALQVGANYTFDQSAAANGWVFHGMVVGNSGGVTVDVYDTTGGNPTFLPNMVGRKIIGSPGGTLFGVPSGSYLFSMGGRGSIPGGITNSASAKINMMATENWTGGGQGSEIQFGTTHNGATSATSWMFLRNTGVLEHLGGAYFHNGMQMDGGLYLQSLGTGITPGAPGFGYAAIGHRSGSTWWYFNPATSSWSFVDFAATGGATTTINGQGPGTLSLVPASGSGLTVSSGGGVISIGQSGLAALANSQIFTNLNRFSGSLTIFDAQVTVGGTLTVNGGVSPNGSAGRTFSFQDLAGVTHNVIYGIIVS